MSWGIDGPFPIADGDTWTGVTGRTWEAHGNDLEWSGYNPEFHLYVDPYPWTTPDWGEMVGVLREMQSFNVRRSVAGWWRGMKSGGGTITIYNEAADIATNYQPSHRIRLSVDVPSGEYDLFTGFIQSHKHIFDARGVQMLQIQVVDHIAYSGMVNHSARTGGTQTTGWCLDNMLRAFGAGLVIADVAGINTAQGLLQNNTIGAGNLIDKLNQYVRGELGMLWLDPSGIWQFRERDWWYPQPSPVATIGSLTRGEGGDRDDPALGDTGFLVQQSHTTAVAEMAYNKVGLTGSGAAAPLFVHDQSTARTGIRYWEDATEQTNPATLQQNRVFLAKVLSSADSYDGPIFDQTRTARFPADVSLNNLEYAAVAELTDFVEVAWEAQAHSWRQWHPAWVMGVKHTWSTTQGWWTELQLEGGLAQFDEEADTGGG